MFGKLVEKSDMILSLFQIQIQNQFNSIDEIDFQVELMMNRIENETH